MLGNDTGVGLHVSLVGDCGTVRQRTTVALSTLFALDVARATLNLFVGFRAAVSRGFLQRVVRVPQHPQEAPLTMASNETKVVSISESERVYITEGVAQDVRLDGRSCLEYRSFDLTTGEYRIKTKMQLMH